MMKEKILIFGGLGFIGKNILLYLFDKYDIYVIDKNIDDEFLEIYKSIKFYQYDFMNDNHIDKLLSQIKPNYAINLISLVSAERKIEMFDLLYQLNTSIIIKQFEALKNISELKLYIHFGSGEEYGNICSPLLEEIREVPNSPYALVKQLATNTVIMLNKNYNFPSLVIRPSNLFGRYQPENKFIPYILNQLSAGNTIETTKGLQKRDFIYINSFVKILYEIILNYNNFIGEIVNIGGGKSYTLRDIVLYMKEKKLSKSNIEFGKIEYRENEIMDFCLSISKLEYLLRKKIDVNFYKDLDEYIENNN